MKITIPVAVEAPTPAQVEGWLVARGMEIVSRSPDWLHFDGPQAEFEIPLRVAALDYPRHLAVALLDIAAISGIEPVDLVTQMREGR